MSDERSTGEQFDPIFLQMVTSLQAAAMMQMGKIINPLTGKVDRSMEHAQNTIDILAMMKRKMEGNLSRPEQDYLDHILYELRMNFVEEVEHPGPSGETPASGDSGGAQTTKSAESESTSESAPSS